MAAACERLDALVKDYLVFRGFTATVKMFDQELKHDKDRGLRADKIVEQLVSYVHTYNLPQLRENWAYLNQRFFSRLEHRYAASVRKLEFSLLKLYVVNAQQNNRPDRVRDFFERMGPELQNQPEFRDWFAFPFLSAPAENMTFSFYFTKQWQETLQLSLYNFLQVVFQAMPLPTLLNFENDYRRMAALQEENEYLKSQLNSGGPVTARKVPSMYTAKDSKPPPLPDLVYDFSGLETETEPVSEKQKPTRRFPINLSAPLLKRKQDPRPEKTKASAARAGAAPPQGQPSGQSSNSSRTRVGSQQTPQPRPPRPTLGASVSSFASSAAKAPASLSTAGGATGTSSSSVVSGRQKSSRHASDASQTASVQGQQQQGADKPAVAGARGKVARELTSFPPYTSPQQERTDLLPPPVSSSGGGGEKSDTVVSKGQSAKAENAAKSSSSEQAAAADPTAPTVPVVMAEPKECTIVEKLGEVQAGAQCPFLLLSEDDYLEHQSAVCYSRFSSTGQHIASLDADGIVKVWTWSPQPSTTATVMSRAPFLSLDWASKSDRWLLLGNKSGQIRLFDTREIKTFREASVEPPYTRVVYLSTCPVTMTFASCVAAAGSATGASVETGGLALWDLRTMNLEKTITVDPVPVAPTCCVHTTTGKQLLAGGADGFLRLYDLAQQQCVMKWPAHRGPVSSIFFGSPESTCFSMGTDGKLCEWSLTQNGNPLRQIVMNTGVTSQHAAQIPQGQLFCLNKDKTYILASTPNHGVICKVCASTDKPSLPRLMDLSKHSGTVTTVDWSPSVETPVCLTGAQDGCLKVFTLLSQ